MRPEVETDALLVLDGKPRRLSVLGRVVSLEDGHEEMRLVSVIEIETGLSWPPPRLESLSEDEECILIGRLWDALERPYALAMDEARRLARFLEVQLQLAAEQRQRPERLSAYLAQVRAAIFASPSFTSPLLVTRKAV